MTRRAAGALDIDEVARELYSGVAACLRRFRQLSAVGDLSLSTRAVLARLDRTGPTTAAELAREEHISSQAMGIRLKELEERGLIERRPDPIDRRRVILSVNPTTREELRHMRDARMQRLAQVLAEAFTPAEVGVLVQAAPLIERMAERL
jgi:DNA-binding MarR family transcriptional regulator